MREGVDIYKVYKPAACSFMKNGTHLQRFKYLANSVLVNILRNSLKCLYIVFVSFFFSATTLQYKQWKKEFYFSNESYNKEQEIVSITLPTSSFPSVRLMKKNCIEPASLVFFYFSIYTGLVTLN